MASSPDAKKPPKEKVSRFAALSIGGFVLTTSVFLLIKGRSPRGSCSYDHIYRRTTCRVKQLTSIPPDVPDVILALHMGQPNDKTENAFTVLQRSNFTRFRHLQELKLVKCGVRDIAADTFADLYGLRSLDLRYNRINTVDESTFRGLKSLEYLYLSNNPITHLADFTFRGIRIENLVLANNPTLGQISGKAFAGAILKTLVMNRCTVAEFPRDVFRQVSESLQQLHVTNSLLPLSLPDDIFQGLTFEVLNLDNNGLTSEGFLTHTVAEEISLDDNPLGDLDIENAVSLRHTRRLSLSNTRQTDLHLDDFVNLSELEELDLEDNDLVLLNSSDFPGMSRLKILDVSGNDLADIVGSFDNFPSLDSLYVDDNDLRYLPETLESVLGRLDNFTVHDNPLHCNCELRWFADFLNTHEGVVDDLTCATPTAQNFTSASFLCAAPTVLNATFDSDGISLVCTAEGDPAPTVTWLSHNGTTSDSAKTSLPTRHRKDVFQTTCTLPISTDGNYTCTAVSLAGTDSVVLDTQRMPAAGFRAGRRTDKIKILETQAGFCVTVMLIVILGFILRYS